MGRYKIKMKKIVIITGANSGIGRASAFQFAKEGYEVILACRNEASGKEVEKEINDRVGSKPVRVMQVNMDSFESIHSFCEAYKRKYNKLDVLIHNAGCFNHGVKSYQLSKPVRVMQVNMDSFESNVFGPFLMTMLLRDLLVKAENPVVIGAGSTNMQHFFDEKRKIDFEDLKGQQLSGRSYNSYKMYGDSKMALFMLILKMSEVFKEDGIRANAVMISATKISKKAVKKLPVYWRVMAQCQNLISKPQEYMANNYYQICESDKLKDMTGKIISGKGEIIEKAPKKISEFNILKDCLINARYYPSYAEDKVAVEKLWQMCHEVTGRKDYL